MTLDFIIEIILLVLLIYLFGLNNGSVFEGGLAGSGLYNYASAALPESTPPISSANVPVYLP